MKKILFILAAMVLSSMGLWAQTEQPTETGFGIIFSDGSTVKGELYAEEGDTAYVLRDQVIAKEQSFKLYDFGTQTAWVTSQHAFLNEHISIQNDSYVSDSAAAYIIAIWKDSLIIALPGDLPEPNARHGIRGGSQDGGEYVVDGYTFVIWNDYSYYYCDGGSKKEFNGKIAIITKFQTGDGMWASFNPPSSVIVNGVEYPVRVIADGAIVKGSSRISTVRINPNIQVLEYSALYYLLGEAYDIIIEDSEQPLFCYHCGDGGFSFVGAFTYAEKLQRAYIGRNLEYDIVKYPTYPPFAYLRTKADVSPNPSIVLGPKVNNLSKEDFFYGIHAHFNLTSETLNPPSAGNLLANADFDYPRPWIPDLTVYAQQDSIYNRQTWGARFNIKTFTSSDTCGGTSWKMEALGLASGECTGYKMTVSRPENGNGIMRDKNNASDYSWYNHHKVITELDIAGGVTHLSKLGWDGYPLQTIYLRAAGPEPLPTIGEGALRGVDTSNIILYVHSTKRNDISRHSEWWKFSANVREIDIQTYQDSTINFMKRICNGYLQGRTVIQGYYETYVSSIRNTYKHEEVETLEEEFVNVLFDKGSGFGAKDKPYLISDVDQLVLYSRITADAYRTKYWTRCALLTDNIDATEKGTEVILGKDQTYPYRSTFDGDNHTIKLNISYANTPAAFISYMSSGTIKNLILKGSVTNTGAGGTSWLSGLIGIAVLDRDTIHIENCVSAVSLTNTNGGTINLGGLVGELSLIRQDGGGKLFISNSCFVGGINAPIGNNIGGLIGSASSFVKMKDCYANPALVNVDYSDRKLAASLVNATNSVQPSIDNCYYANFPDFFIKQGIETKKDSIVCGALCYALNKGVGDGTQAWYQHLSEPTDSIPYPFSRYRDDVVYKDRNGEYGNDCTHRFDGHGFCTVCGAINPNAKEVTISSNEQMKQWAALVNEGHGDVSVKLVADVNYEYMGNNVTYTGTFDGQGHKVYVNLWDSAKPVMWANFAGTLRNTTFILDFPVFNNESASTNNFALIDNCKGAQVENCVFQLKWQFARELIGVRQFKLGGWINTVGGQTYLNNCAFVGKTTIRNRKMYDVYIIECSNLFVRDGNAGKLTISNSYEYICLQNVYLTDAVTCSSSLPLPAARNCYSYKLYPELEKKDPVPNDLADKLNGTQSPKIWKWGDISGDFVGKPIPFERSASREGKQVGNEFTVDGYTYVLWENYSYFFQDKDVTVTIPGTIAAVKAFAPNDTAAFCPPQTVTYENRSYPIAVIMENMAVPHPAKTREIRIRPSIRCIEYAALTNFQDAVQNVIIEDSEEPLYLGPSRSGGQLEFAGGLSQLKFLNYCYVGRNIINCKPEWNKNYGPLAEWRGSQPVSVVWGQYTTQPGHHFFYNADISKIKSVIVNTLNPPTIDYEILSNPAPSNPIDKPFAIVGWNMKVLYSKIPNWTANFRIEELPPYTGVSKGTRWNLSPIFNPTGDICLGYKMNVTASGTGIMENKDTVSEHGWYNHHKVIHELNIESGVTHLSKLGWDGYSLQAIYVHAVEEEFPTIGANAFRGLDRRKVFLYINSSKREELTETDDWKEFTNIREIDIQVYRDSTIDFMKRICDGYLQKGHPINDVYEKYVNAINNVFLHEEVARLEEEFVSALFAAGSGSGLQDKPYLISNVDQLVLYSRLTEDKVRMKYAERCARMTADIDATKEGTKVILGKESGYSYCGSFDGDKHYLKLNINGGDQPAAFISYMSSGTIKNLIVTGAISISSDNESQLAGLIGVVSLNNNDVHIENCVSAVTITNPNQGTTNLGGLVGESSGSDEQRLLISNSCFVGRIDAPKENNIGGLVGNASSNVTLKDCFVSSNTTTLINADEVTIDNCYINPVKDSIVCGALCYALNKGVTDGAQAWYQHLSNPQDSIPYPFSRYSDDIVIRHSDGKYYNTIEHKYDESGFCTVCGAINPNAKEVTISSADQMKQWAALVNEGHGDVSVKLATDVDYEYIGKDVTYTGTFDGQGHKVYVNFKNDATTKPAMWANFAGTLRNTYFEETFPDIQHGNPIDNTLALIGNCKRARIENCVFRLEWTIKLKLFLDGAWNLGGVIDSVKEQVLVKNCAFLGKIKLEGTDWSRYLHISHVFFRVGESSVKSSSSYTYILNNKDEYLRGDVDRVYLNGDNNYRFENEDLPSQYELLNNLNRNQSPEPWLWVDKQGAFGRIPVPFNQCGIHWNGDEGGEDALPQILAPAQRANKYMEDGRIVIQRGNKYYDIYGKEL